MNYFDGFTLNLSFSLNFKGKQEILNDMVAPLVQAEHTCQLETDGFANLKPVNNHHRRPKTDK